MNKLELSVAEHVLCVDSVGFTWVGQRAVHKGFLPSSGFQGYYQVIISNIFMVLNSQL